MIKMTFLTLMRMKSLLVWTYK